MSLVLGHEWLSGLRGWLEEMGYSRVSVRFYLACLHRLADWLVTQQWEPSRLAEEGVLELYFAQHKTVRGRSIARGYRSSIRVAVSAWLRYARQMEWIAQKPIRTEAELEARPLQTPPWLESFENHLRQSGYRRFTRRAHLGHLSRLKIYLDQQELPLPALAADEVLQGYCLKRTQSVRNQVRQAVQCWLKFARAAGLVAQLDCPADETPELICGYLQFAREHRGLSAGALHGHKTQLLALARYLTSQGHPRLVEIPLPLLDSFLAQRCQTRDEIIRSGWSLRAFLRYLFLIGEEVEDRSRWLTAPRTYQNQRLPKHLSDQQLGQALMLIDRKTAQGKKRWAVFALLVNYGLRVGEVADLHLDEVDLGGGLLRVRRSKTGAESLYPLTPAVEEALRQYLAVRPVAPYPQLFLTSRAPHRPYASGGSLASPCLASTLKLVHGAPGKGGHVLRHTLARRLRQSGVPLQMIRQVLGHKASASTGRYLRIALDELREVADNYAELL